MCTFLREFPSIRSAQSPLSLTVDRVVSCTERERLSLSRFISFFSAHFPIKTESIPVQLIHSTIPPPPLLYCLFLCSPLSLPFFDRQRKSSLCSNNKGEQKRFCFWINQKASLIISIINKQEENSALCCASFFNAHPHSHPPIKLSHCYVFTKI